jgi:RND family efflux transporter MFP subunit
LVSSQEEYLIALRAKDTLNKSSYPEVSSGANSLLEATRRRFRLWDISESELKTIEKTGKPLTYMTIYSHMNGYIIERMFFPGMHVAEHEDVLVMADLSTVWVIADIYEYELPSVKEGEEATLQLSYYPGETFTGKVMYIYPMLDTNTRTAKARFEFPNPNNKLKPGMYANVTLLSSFGEILSVAEDSVIDTGERQVVFIASGDGYFEPREVKVGEKSGGVL